MLKKFQSVHDTFQKRVIAVDKKTDCWTVSQKFRDDIKDFFEPQKFNFLEVGCYKGLTAKLLADHFLQYLGLDVNSRYLRVARINNIFNFNVKFQRFDLYNSNWNDLTFAADVILIDALHEYEYIKQDIDNCLKRFNNVYIIFDDYGAWESVFRAVNEAIDQNQLEFVQEIGMEKDQQLWSDQSNPRAYTHFGSEGLICRRL